MKETILEWIVALVFIGGAWWYAGHHAVEEYKQEVAGEQAKADKLQRAKYEGVAQELEELKLKRAANAKIIQKETERIVERPVYVNSCWDDDGLLNANAAIRGTNSTKSETALPANPRD